MPSYRIDIVGYRNADSERRSFARYVDAPTPAAARASLGSRPVQDMSDMLWFDQWRITDTHKVDKFEVVATDSSLWHSSGVASIAVEYGKRAANARLRLMLAGCKPGHGAFIRPAK